MASLNVFLISPEFMSPLHLLGLLNSLDRADVM